MNDIISLIQKVREQRKRLENQERELIMSFHVADLDIEILHQAYLKVKKIDRLCGFDHKKMFVFTCLSFVCPTFIIGDKIKPGIRSEIARITNLSSARISNIANEVRFLYSHYKDFKQEADYLYSEIKRSLTS